MHDIMTRGRPYRKGSRFLESVRQEEEEEGGREEEDEEDEEEEK